MKYYPKNSSSIEYIELPDTVEENSSIIIIKAKSRRDLTDLNGLIQMMKREEVPTMGIKPLPDDGELRLQLFEKSDYLTLFRWMTENQFITRDDGTVFYKAHCERLAIHQNPFKSPFAKLSPVSENVTNDQGVRQPTLNPF